MAIFKPNARWDVEFHEPRGMTGRYVKKKGRQTALLARRFVGVDTGLLKASIAVGDVERGLRGPTVLVGADAVKPGDVKSYARDHHEGTQPHVIKGPATVAGRGALLRVPLRGGRVVMLREVHHPGTKANPFLTKALRIAIAAR